MESETTAPRIGRRSAKLRNFKFWETESYATVHCAHWHGDAARPRQCRHRPDGAETISQGADARRICAEFSALQRRIRLAGARQFRMRLQPRARSVGR